MVVLASQLRKFDYLSWEWQLHLLGHYHPSIKFKSRVWNKFHSNICCSSGKKYIILQKSNNPKYQCRKKQPAENRDHWEKATTSGYKKSRSSFQNCTCNVRDKVISEDDWKGKNLADESPTSADTAEKLFKYKPTLPFSKQVASNDLVCMKCSFLLSICRRSFDCLWFLF